ncbi:MAG: polysaccharide biosynthesis C-terminal domain-containing protein, partial [Clostridiales bacterium]|nr:polysaccharide biosynthesis C-terminal domain-containing protein [Candidatus Blautia equi]
MTKDKAFYRSFFSLCIVLMLQNIVVISVNLADNIMLGGFSETALAGAAAVNQIQFVFQQLLSATGEGIVIFGSQYWGKHQHEPVKKITATALHTGLALAVILFVMVSVMPYRMVGMFTENEAIVAEGVKYILIMRFSYLFFAVTMVMQAALRCAEMVRISLYLSIMTFFVNCGINSVLIYGRFGAPRMGIQGAAIGTLTARILECVVILCYAANRSHAITFRGRDFLEESSVLRKDYYKKVAPMMVVQGLWGLNNAFQTMILGHMSDSAIAASSVSSTLFLLVKSMAVGAASSASVIVGKTIGAGKIDTVKE